MRISDWSSDVCSSDLLLALALQALVGASTAQARPAPESFADLVEGLLPAVVNIQTQQSIEGGQAEQFEEFFKEFFRSEEHTSELQSLMRISYAVFCLQKKKIENSLLPTTLSILQNYNEIL